MRTDLPIITFLFFVVSISLHADTLSLSQAVQSGLKQNYGILLARIETKKADNTKKLKTGYLLPQVSTQASLNHTRTDNESNSPLTPAGTSKRKSASLGASLSWTLFDGFRMFHAANLVDERINYSNEAIRLQVEGTVTAIISTCYELIAQEALLRVAGDKLALSKDILKRYEMRSEYGGSGKRDVLHARVIVNADSAAIDNQKLAVILARDRLNILLGRSPELTLTVTADTLVNKPQHNAEFWFEKAKTASAALSIEHIKIRMQELQTALTRSAFWPMVVGTGAYAASRTDGDDAKQLSAGVNLSWNIFTGFKRSTDLQNARLDRQSAVLAQKQKILEIKAQVYELFERMKNAYGQIRFETDAQELARLNLDITRQLFSNGAVSDITLREAQLEYVQVYIRLESARYLFHMAETQLHQLAGMVNIE